MNEEAGQRSTVGSQQPACGLCNGRVFGVVR